MFYILSILVLILNASIPVINQIEKFPIVVTIVASISTVITGIITLINFKDVWYRYRVTAEKIKTECMLLNCRLGQYSCVNREKKFLIRIEEILAEDQESWIKSRFTDNEEDEEDKWSNVFIEIKKFGGNKMQVIQIKVEILIKDIQLGKIQARVCWVIY